MDVTGAGGNSLGDDMIDELDDRTLGLLFIELALGRIGVFNDGLDRRFSSPIQQLADTIDGGVDLLDALHDPVGCSERHPYGAAGGKGEHVLAVEVIGIGGRDVEDALGNRERQNGEPARQLLRNPLAGFGAHQQIGCNPEVGACRERLENLVIGDQSGIDGSAPIAVLHARLELGETCLRKTFSKERQEPLICRCCDEDGAHDSTYRSRRLANAPPAHSKIPRFPRWPSACR